ncbi:hypothetical protein SDC9_124854 [bioreactor metagenome]|uniref:Uncharacterized protein n=1 Tax=bioreactor metagenome TaxID=1076179 RepID=A0A645CLI7_9ZZZZ
MDGDDLLACQPRFCKPPEVIRRGYPKIGREHAKSIFLCEHDRGNSSPAAEVEHRAARLQRKQRKRFFEQLCRVRPHDVFL